MDYNKITRSQHCNIHIDQSIISVCLESDCYRPVLCSECIKDPDIHPTKHKVESLKEFCTKYNRLEIQDDLRVAEKETNSELINTAKEYTLSIKTVKENIELEKKLIEESINEFISAFVLRCHHFKQEVWNVLDDQLAIFNNNYKNFVRVVANLPKDSEDVQEHPSLIESMNKSATYNQVENLLKQRSDHINKAKNKSKQIDDDLINLKTVAHTLRDNTAYPCTTSLANSNLEKLKQNLVDVVDVFFKKNLELERKFSPLELDPSKLKSQILQPKESPNLIKDFFKGIYKAPTFSLLYRASRDGSNAADFHRMCNNKGPTLTIIQSTNGRRFGGFTDIEWTNVETYSSSKNSFLFSVDLQEKYFVKPEHEQYAVKNIPTEGPCFGGGHDLRLSTNFKIDKSTGYIGFSYEVKNKYAKDIYGDTSFFVQEVEVFAVSEGLDEGEIGLGKIAKDFQQKHQEEEHKLEDRNSLMTNLKDGISINLANRNNVNEIDKKEAQYQSKAIQQNCRSNIVSNDQFETMIDWINKTRNFSVDLIYRGMVDGFSSDNFHSKCDNKGPTLTIIKTKRFQHTFGGFTMQSWDKSNQPAKCNKTFVFSITNQRVLPILDEESAIFKSESAGPVFGNGDIYICSNADVKADSYSNLGLGFDAADLSSSVSFLAGEENFTVQDIEVFKITFLS